MTYGWVPGNWDAFARELDARGLAPGDIERIEIRPVAGTLVEVIVTARSGRKHTWRQAETPPGA